MATAKTTPQGQPLDKPQVITLEVAETAANGGKVVKFPSSLTTKDKVGLLIHEVQYYLGFDGLNLLVGAEDCIFHGLTQLYNAGVAPADGDEQGLVDFQALLAMLRGAAANMTFINPVVRTVFDEPFLVHPASIYAFIRGNSLTDVAQMMVRMRFSYVALTTDDYQEILQTIILQDSL